MAGITVALTENQSQFASALSEFVDELENGEESDLIRFTSIEDLYKEIEATQQDQGQRLALRNLRRLQPFLDGVAAYSGVLNNTVQVKPDVLAAIWGSLKFLIQISKNYVKAFDCMLDATRKIGECLPEFQELDQMFKDRKGLSEMLCLFYKDILDFYTIMFKFFRIQGWKTFFDALWPHHSKKIAVVLRNIENHNLLFNSEVGIADVREARSSRIRALEEYEREAEARERRSFEACKAELSPCLYDEEIQVLKNECSEHTCHWLEKDREYQRWAQTKSKTNSILWLSGIPGAGKSHLAATVASGMKDDRKTVLFAFFNFQQREDVTRIKLLHTLIFQLIYQCPDLRPVLVNAYETDFRELQSYVGFNQKLVSGLLQSAGLTYVILDGLDEIGEKNRQSILKGSLDLSNQCPLLKILISSRDEADIGALLRSRALSVRVGNKNAEDIRRYLKLTMEDWLDDLNIGSDTYSEILRLAEAVPERANGMFLYVRLVVQHLQGQNDVESIRKEIQNLPAGLDVAYLRIIQRIEKLHPKEFAHGKSILGWIACSRIPLRKQEIMQALTIRQGDSRLCGDRAVLQDLQYFCGPIVQEQGGHIGFVHFTAKEYLFSDQSGPWLKESAMHRQIANTCIDYLMLGCFEMDLPAVDHHKSVLNGDFTLQAYAVTSWLEHVKRGVEGNVSFEDLESLLTKVSFLIQRRVREEVKLRDEKEKAKQLELEAKAKNKSKAKVKIAVKCVPELEKLRYFDDFQSKWLNDLNEYLMNDGDAEQDPLTFTKSWTLFESDYQSYLCPSDQHRSSCYCKSLENSYGPRLYKCDRLLCPLARLGFASKSARDRHVQFHRRIFKCTFSEKCPFGQIGFTSQGQLDRHTELVHMGKIRITEESHKTQAELPQDEVEQAMIDAVEMNEVVYLDALLDKYRQPPLSLLLVIAYIRAAGVPVLDLLLQRGAVIDDSKSLDTLALARETQNFPWPGTLHALRRIQQEYDIFMNTYNRTTIDNGPRTAMSAAIEGGSLDTVKWLVSNGIGTDSLIETPTWSASNLVYLTSRQKLRCGRAESYKQLPLEIIKYLLDTGANVTDGKALNILTECSFPAEEESAYVEAARLLVEHGAVFKSDALHHMVPKPCSVEIARLALENGAELDAPFAEGHAAHTTPLSRVVKVANPKSGAFAAFLIESGAQIIPEGGKLGKSKQFAKWAGMTWDELILSTENLRPGGGPLRIGL